VGAVRLSDAMVGCDGGGEGGGGRARSWGRSVAVGGGGNCVGIADFRK